MRLLITGGAGFQGLHLAEHWWQAGHAVTLFNTYSLRAERQVMSVSPAAKVIWGSVTDPESVQKAVRDHDVIVHLAAWTHVDHSLATPIAALAVNVIGTYHVLQAVRAEKKALIFSSSCEVYGPADPGTDQAEDSPLRPCSPYAASKAAADRLCYAFGVSYGVPIVTLRPCNIYGPRQRSGQHDGAMLPKFVQAALRGEPIPVRGSGLQSREFLHVADLVRAYDAILNRLASDPDTVLGEVFNVGSGEQIGVLQLAEHLAAHVGGRVEHVDRRPGEVSGFRLDSTKIRKSLGVEPRVRFWETGLWGYVEWARGHLDPACVEASKP